jgi:hypothetical protein
VTGAALLALVTPPLVPSADAHHGYAGPVRLYLENVRLEPRAGEWLLRAAVNDSGSGEAAPGFLVQAVGSGPQGAAFGPVALTDPDADGRYETGLGPLPAGDWSFTLEVGDAPGGEERAVPLTRTWPATLQPGQGLDVIGGPSAPGGGSTSRTGDVVLPVALTGGVVALLGLIAGRSRRRRDVAPAG